MDASNNNPQKYYESNVVGRSCVELITHEVSHDKYYGDANLDKQNHTSLVKLCDA